MIESSRTGSISMQPISASEFRSTRLSRSQRRGFSRLTNRGRGLLPVLALLIAAPLSAEPDASFPWVTGLDISRPPAPGPRPNVNRRFIDAVHGTTIQRITQDTTNWRRHEYSRRPAFNADSSRIIMRSSGGFWHLYRIASNAVIYEQALPSPMTEPNWHPTDPDRYWYFTLARRRSSVDTLGRSTIG